QQHVLLLLCHAGDAPLWRRAMAKMEPENARRADRAPRPGSGSRSSASKRKLVARRGCAWRRRRPTHDHFLVAPHAGSLLSLLASLSPRHGGEQRRHGQRRFVGAIRSFGVRRESPLWIHETKAAILAALQIQIGRLLRSSSILPGPPRHTNSHPVFL